MNVSPEIARLLRSFQPGQRIRAACDILYGWDDADVREGDAGTVTHGTLLGLCFVVWDRFPDRTLLTSTDSLDPLSNGFTGQGT